MKKAVLFFILFFSFFCVANITAQAQENYATHIVVKGETLSGIAKTFHTTTSELMRINNFNSKSILKIGEKIKVPAAKKTVAPKESNAENVIITTHPIMHTVKKGETLYSLSKKFGSSIAQLKSWNKLSSDVIVDGKSLIIGFEADDNQPVVQNEVNETAEKQSQSNDSVASVTFVPAADTSQNQVKDTVENTKVSPVTEPIVPMTMQEIFFKNGSGKNLHVTSGNAMTFESSATNADGANYILMNELPAGTIVKITAASGESLYAKVLWKLDMIPSNEGLDFRINNAAAKTLGISDQKFALAITYFDK
ncbi:MAG: LysM peptidoglycan-binding domain-containing protein [Chitinophagaceae bacterium]